jgi:hypothetical protein
MGEFRRDIEEGEEFQDFVKRKLWGAGIAVEFYSSRKFQASDGEGPSGVEVKKDRRFRDTGNLYIETEHCIRGEWLPSGINRNPAMWLMAIGDEEEFFLIQKTLLQAIEQNGRYRSRETRHTGDVPTRGFLFPVEEMRRLAAKVFKSQPEQFPAEVYTEDDLECQKCGCITYELRQGSLCADCYMESIQSEVERSHWEVDQL